MDVTVVPSAPIPEEEWGCISDNLPREKIQGLMEDDYKKFEDL